MCRRVRRIGVGSGTGSADALAARLSRALAQGVALRGQRLRHLRDALPVRGRLVALGLGARVDHELARARVGDGQRVVLGARVVHGARRRVLVGGLVFAVDQRQVLGVHAQAHMAGAEHQGLDRLMGHGMAVDQHAEAEHRMCPGNQPSQAGVIRLVAALDPVHRDGKRP